MRSYLYVYKIKKEESSDIFLRICHSIEVSLKPSFIEKLIVDFDKSRIQRYMFPNNRILLYDDVLSDIDMSRMEFREIFEKIGGKVITNLNDYIRYKYSTGEGV